MCAAFACTFKTVPHGERHSRSAGKGRLQAGNLCCWAAQSFATAVNFMVAFAIGQSFLATLCAMRWGTFLFYGEAPALPKHTWNLQCHLRSDTVSRLLSC